MNSHNSAAMKLLLVEDSLACQLVVTRTLASIGEITVAPDLALAQHFLTRNSFDLVLLDVGLPDGSGFDFCTALKTHQKSQSPRVIFLSGNTADKDKLAGFSVGADDYLTKPFNPLELKARVEAQLRSRTESIDPGRLLNLGNLTFDLVTASAEIQETAGKRPLNLTPTEFKIIYGLAVNVGRILFRDQLIQILIQSGTRGAEKSLDVHVCKLRKKLIGATHGIESVYGVGYRLTLTMTT